MLVILKLPTGGMKNLELEGSDSIEAVRLQVAAQTQVHPEHQRLILMDGDVELTDGKKTVADYGIRLESEIRLAPRPPPRVVDLTVGRPAHHAALHPEPGRGLAPRKNVRWSRSDRPGCCGQRGWAAGGRAGRNVFSIRPARC
jgi:hypothetical protein